MRYLLLVALMTVSICAYSQSIIPWTEENGTLGLGYPVPIPVDTTEAFDGFRTYAGLFAKHQSIDMNNPYVTGQVVGQTREGRDIWAYVFSDDNNLSQYGVKEGAMLINGSIHAREWQSPEVMTGIMELLDANSNDHSLHQYLLENTTIVILPVNNVDGLLQTQRYPSENWYSSQTGPRDGRMRRKNMLDVDEDLQTQADHLLGVDLNRNNSPYWATSNNSSFNATSIVYHGAASESEPETQARLNAAALVEPSQVRIYTDVHSFSQVHLSVLTENQNKNILQAELLKDFSDYHKAFPAAKNYIDSASNPMNGGYGSTDEYFAETYQVPSWTLEVEPTGRGAVDYGGFGRNGNDGFILPESQIKRVREELAQSFVVAWYEQAGPPSITQLRIIEKDSGNIIYDGNWDIQEDGSRKLFQHIIQNILPNVEYSLLISFDKPMRMRDENNQIVHLQGQNSFPLKPTVSLTANGIPINIEMGAGQWINQKSEDVISYKFYKDDTYRVDFSTDVDFTTTGGLAVGWNIDVADMVGQKLDSNPESIVTWSNGQWQNYEDDNDVASISGGEDRGYAVLVDETTVYSFPPLIQPSGLYFDPTRSGEGFSYELLEDGHTVWIQWFTYDTEGHQKWYSGLGQFKGNAIIVDSLTEAQGGVFGAGFDANNISFEDFGSLEITFDGGEAILPPIGSHEVTRTAQVLFTDTNGKKLRTHLSQLSFVKGAINQPLTILATFKEPVGKITGSWYDPTRSGEGYILEILEDGRAILVWYSYDLSGNLMWLIDSDGVITTQGNDITLDFTHVQVSQGGVFGADFDSSTVQLSQWGEVHFQLRCEGTGTVTYSSILNGFGSGQHNVTKLTHPLLIPFVCEE